MQKVFEESLSCILKASIPNDIPPMEFGPQVPQVVGIRYQGRTQFFLEQRYITGE